MLSALAKIWRNKIFAVFIILILISSPATLYKQSDKDKTIVATSIGVEVIEDEYQVSILAVIPKGENDINSNLELFDAKGKSISQALDKITLDIGRNIGLAHCDCIIFHEDLMQDNLTQILDYFIRTANLSTNPTLIATPDSTKDLLNAVKTSNNLLDLSLKNIIMSQEERSLLSNVTIDRFYRAYYSPNSTFAIPIINVEKSGSNEGEGGGSGSSDNSSGGGSQGGGGSAQGSAGGSQQQSKITNKGDIAIIRDGKFLSHLSDDEKFIYTLLSKTGEYQKFVLEDINDEHFIDSTVVFQEADKIVVAIPKFEDGKPVMEYNIWLSLMIDEVVSSKNHSFASTNGTINYLTDNVKEKINAMIDEKLENTISLMQTKHYDILNVYEKFNAFKYRKFQDYINSLEDDEYMSDMSFRINLKLNYVI